MARPGPSLHQFGGHGGQARSPAARLRVGPARSRPRRRLIAGAPAPASFVDSRARSGGRGESMTDTAIYVFWACFALTAYTYFGYPAVIGGLARLFGRPHRIAAHEP